MAITTSVPLQVQAGEDADWLDVAAACKLDADGNVDPECESCQ